MLAKEGLESVTLMPSSCKSGSTHFCFGASMRNAKISRMPTPGDSEGVAVRTNGSVPVVAVSIAGRAPPVAQRVNCSNRHDDDYGFGLADEVEVVLCVL